MTAEQINIKIAEACGWTFAKEEGCGDRLNPDWYCNFDMPIGSKIPDYYNDLNACHEMETGLTLDQRNDYICALGGLCQEPDYADWAGVCFATAPQRCEAFLRTLGLWGEETK